MEEHSQVSPSRWAFVWPSGTGATNILPIRLYKSPHDFYTHTYTHTHFCYIQQFRSVMLKVITPKSPSIGNIHSQFLSGAPKFNRLKEKHTLKQMVYLNDN